MRLLLSLSFLILISVQSFGQRDAAHWFFGNFAGLDFGSEMRGFRGLNRAGGLNGAFTVILEMEYITAYNNKNP